MNIKILALLFVGSTGFATEYPSGEEVTAARHIIDRTYEAAEACDYALRVTKQYNVCDEYYNLAVRNSGQQSLRQAIRSNKVGGSEFLEATFVVFNYDSMLTAQNEKDPDFTQWFSQYQAKVLGILNLDTLLLQARMGQLYVPAN